MLTKQDLKEIVNIINQTMPVIINTTVPNIVREIINETVPQIVENIVEPKFEEFAMIMKNRFDEVDEALDKKADKTDIDSLDNNMIRLENNMIRLENKITGIENKSEGRIENNIPIVKTKLKLS